MAELLSRRDEPSASSTTCREKLLQEQKNLTETFAKGMTNCARTVALKKEREIVTTDYKETRSSVVQLVGFANTTMTRLEAKIAKVIQERDASMAKADQLLLEVQCVSKLVERAKKLREHLPALDTVARFKISNGGKLPTSSSKQKKANAEVGMKQVRM